MKLRKNRKAVTLFLGLALTLSFTLFSACGGGNSPEKGGDNGGAQSSDGCGVSVPEDENELPWVDIRP